MSKPNYRVSLSFDSGRKVFIARAAELDPCTAEGATRAEAITRLEEEIDAQLANMLAHGSTPPKSVDEEEFSGEVTLKLSKTQHRELAFVAKNEGVDVDHLVAELVSSSLSERRGPKGARTGQPNHDGNRHGGNGNGNGNRGNYGGRGNNMALLDDRANFIEYVRNLDSGTGQPHRGPGGGGGGGGGGHGGGPGGGQNRNRRGGRNNRGPGGRPNQGGGGGGQPQHARGPAPAGGGNPSPGNGAPSGNSGPSGNGGGQNDEG